MNQTRKIARRDAAELMIALEKGRRIERRHAERIIEGNTEPLRAIAHRLVHGQVRTSECSVLKLQASVPARDRAALQFETIRPSRRCRHGVGNQHHAVVGLRRQRHLEGSIMHMLAVGDNPERFPLSTARLRSWANYVDERAHSAERGSVLSDIISQLEGLLANARNSKDAADKVLRAAPQWSARVEQAFGKVHKERRSKGEHWLLKVCRSEVADPTQVVAEYAADFLVGMRLDVAIPHQVTLAANKNS